MTPSGFVIGMILKITRFLSSIASGCVGEVIYEIKPCMRKEAMVSPGWTREQMMMYFLNLLSGTSSRVENSLSSMRSKVF